MSQADSSAPKGGPRYRIGAVCRLTGISQHVLRVWEKRYAVVKPERSETDRRLYKESDVTRLSLLKALVDRGQAIGSIANLDNVELERRIEKSAGSVQMVSTKEKPTLVLIGKSLSVSKFDCTSSEIFTLKGHYDDISEYTDQIVEKRLDVAVLEWPNLQADSVAEIKSCASLLNAKHLILIYNYAPRAAVRRIANDRVTALRSPLDIAALEAVVCRRFGFSGQHQDLPATADTTRPYRQFNDGDLAYLAAQSSTIACECPMHLAQLIFSLVHFEEYCGECESRNADDAELHRYLHNTTSDARQLMERALLHVVELENLSLPSNT